MSKTQRHFWRKLLPVSVAAGALCLAGIATAAETANTSGSGPMPPPVKFPAKFGSLQFPQKFPEGTTLSITQWSHFVPRYDKWFDAFARKWGDENGVQVSVDHINIADLASTTASELSANSGHDLIELGPEAAQFEPSLVDMADINQEMAGKHGKPFGVAERVSYNPVTKKRYAFCHGWTIDPGD